MNTLNITKRNMKKKTWELRENHLIPGSVYGATTDSTPIKIDRSELRKVLRDEGEVFKVDTVTGPKFVKFIDVQKDPVTKEILHFSLVELPKDQESKVEIPIKLEGTPKGVQNGGVLVVFKDSVNVYGMVEDIPEKIKENINDLRIGETVTVDDLSLENDLDIEESDDTVIAICRPPVKSEEEMKIFWQPLEVRELVAMPS